jgi:NADH-quinone oxidoreductase subunit N
MYFGEERSDTLDHQNGGVLTVVLMASAVIMIVGIANMFGVEGMAASAAASLVN